jgi:hypothetical protein
MFLITSTRVEGAAELYFVKELFDAPEYSILGEDSRIGSNETCFFLSSVLDCEALFWLNLRAVLGS